MKTKKPKPVTKETENSITFGAGVNLQNNSKNEISKAKEVLSATEQIERDKLKKGFKWLTNGKTNKLTHPDKVEDNLKDGWRLTKI